MYIKTIMNFQESTTILNAHTKKSGNLSYAPRIYIYIYIYIYVCVCVCVCECVCVLEWFRISFVVIFSFCVNVCFKVLCVCIYIVLFGPVKPELGGIPSGPKKLLKQYVYIYIYIV